MQHSFAFDPTYGYNEAALQSVACPPAPADFATFWRETYVLAKQLAPRPTLRLIHESRQIKIFEVEFDAWNDEQPIRIGGWMTIPTIEKINSGLIVGHGYGGRSGPDLSPLISSAAVLYPCARGFNRSAHRGIPNIAERHVLHGIQSRESYVHRGCAIDLWAAAWALVELEPLAANWLCYAGESFGGGIGALAIAWEPLFKRAFLDYPSFGHHPLRLGLQCVGSGEAIRRAGGEKHLPVLQYFDAATAASCTTIPVMVAAALFDPAVPPPGQFAVYNCLAGPKELFVRQAAHFEWFGAAAEDSMVKQAEANFLRFDQSCF